jgi:uncharacterized protein YraI
MRRESLTIALLLALALPAGAETFGAVTTGAVNVRSGAGTEFERLTTLPRGTPVSVDVCDGGWCSIKADGVSGWVSARYLAGLAAGGVGILPTYRPPSTAVPTIPPPVTPLVVPRKDYHYYGYSRQHKFQRPFD